MLSLIYSLLESFEASPSLTFISMTVLSAYTWTSGLYATIPKYAIVDFILSIWTLLHLFVAISFVSMADAFYKKTLLKLHHRIAKFLHGIPMLVPGSAILLTSMVAMLSWQAYQDPQDSAILFRALISIYTLVCSILLQKLSRGMIKMGVDFAMNAEQQVQRHDIKAWKAPAKWTTNVFAPMNWFLRPQVVGAENIPTDYPGLYVMNHATLGIEMIPFVSTIYRMKDVFLRGLGDNMHFGQLHGELLRYFGSVNGTRDNVDALMENKDNVLVYPGGGHEIMKPCAVPNYTLMWKQRLGFARMAIKHGYPIVPCCSVGTEDMMDRLFDIDLGWVRKDQKLPVCVLSPHKLQRVYFWFGEPIPTAQYKGDYMNDEFAKEVRDKAKAAIEAGIRELQERQANDPDRFLFRHMANAMVRFCKDPFGGSSGSMITKHIDDIKEETVPASKKLD